MSDRLFISSVQRELAEERRAIRDFVRGDALLRRFFGVFVKTNGRITNAEFQRLSGAPHRSKIVFGNPLNNSGIRDNHQRGVVTDFSQTKHSTSHAD